MKFILLICIFLIILVVPFVLVISPNESLELVTWLSIPTWFLHGGNYSDNLFDIVKPTYTLVAVFGLAVASSLSKIIFITLVVLTVLASIFSAFWLNYLINAA